MCNVRRSIDFFKTLDNDVMVELFRIKTKLNYSNNSSRLYTILLHNFTYRHNCWYIYYNFAVMTLFILSP